MNQLITAPHLFTFTEQEKCCINELKKLVEDSLKLHTGTEDEFLSKYLYFTNWDVKKAFEILNGYYDFKRTHDEIWITNKSPEDFKDILVNTGARYILPKTDKNGRYVFVYRLPNVFDRYPNFIDIITELDGLILETIAATRRGQENGIAIIFDLRNFSRRYLKFAKPNNLMILNKKNAVFPLKNRIFHVIQTGFLLNVAMGMIWPFLGGILENNTTWHKDTKSEKLKEMIGYEALPHEYGGPEENVLDGNVLYNLMLENWESIKKTHGYNKEE